MELQGADNSQNKTTENVSNLLNSEVIHIITTTLKCNNTDITDISVLKKGMTNRSFLFNINGTKYILRIPGEGTDQLIDREKEASVFEAINGLGFCDAPIYINPKTGYKLSKYLNGARICDCNNVNDLKQCMKKLQQLHNMNLKVSHTFDIWSQIEFYEVLRGKIPSIYGDYKRTKENILSLRTFVDSLKKDWCLTHIDAVPDNFLFYTTDNGQEALQLTDWEYAGMQDPHVDIAMFCIYSLYNKHQCDMLIDIYFGKRCDKPTRAKIYCYISMCGLLWSNWCEFKKTHGVEFGEYSLRQFNYAKEFYIYAKELMEVM